MYLDDEQASPKKFAILFNNVNRGISIETMNDEQQTKVLVEKVLTVYSDEISDRRSGYLKLGNLRVVSPEELKPRPANTIEDSGKQVRKWRKIRGLTMAALANAVGISEAYLSQIENGKRQGRVSTFQKIAQALDIDLSKLI